MLIEQHVVPASRPGLELRQIAVLDAVFDARRLVLVPVIFPRLGEADGRQPRLEKREVVASATESVLVKHEPHRVAPDEQHWFLSASGTQLSVAVAAGLIGYYLVYAIGVRIRITRHEKRRHD